MEPPIWLGSVWAGMSFALAYVSRRRTGLVLLFLAIAIVGCGMAAGQIRSAHVAAPVLKDKIGPVEVRGQLVKSGIGSVRQRYILADLTIAGVAANDTPKRVRITVHVPPRSAENGVPSARRPVRSRPGRGILAGNPGFKASARSAFPMAPPKCSNRSARAARAVFPIGCAVYGMAYRPA